MRLSQLSHDTCEFSVASGGYSHVERGLRRYRLFAHSLQSLIRWAREFRVEQEGEMLEARVMLCGAVDKRPVGMVASAYAT
jgi:hypothetical protein